MNVKRNQNILRKLKLRSKIMKYHGFLPSKIVKPNSKTPTSLTIHGMVEDEWLLFLVKTKELILYDYNEAGLKKFSIFSLKKALEKIKNSEGVS